VQDDKGRACKLELRAKTQTRALNEATSTQWLASPCLQSTFNLNLNMNLVTFFTSAWACPCMSPLMGPKRACDADSLPSTWEVCWRTQEAIGLLGSESRGVGSGGLGTLLPLQGLGPRPNALCVRGSATSRGQVHQRDESAMDAARGSTATAPRAPGPGENNRHTCPRGPRWRAAHERPRLEVDGFGGMLPATSMRPRAIVCIP
jgi:hypothetical protein